MKKPYNFVPEQMFVSRITSKGQITNLSKGFKLASGMPFSVYVRPKTLTTLERDMMLNCMLYNDNECSPVPVGLFQWVELEIEEIAPSDTLLESYDIWWGCGTKAEPQL